MKKKMQDIVKRGYEKGDYEVVYRNRQSLNDFEAGFFEELRSNLPAQSSVLDLGSGPGVPYDLYLVQQGFSVTGIELSSKHLKKAKKSVPEAEYILGDFLNHPFTPLHYDGAIALYSLFHVPRERHQELLSKVGALLKPKGHLLITVGTEDVPYKERESFCGAEMAWSFFDAETNMRMITESGFTILKMANEKDFGSAESHLWVLARKD
ncbi:MAG: class I SAM-dependent methyltransferase [Candidatus Moraniibacteriota bacterium]|nr:MAG: class I SAM-dependent methyltransferase [Candidatus Moranbacteria bacterium]